jgi:hypothetical protein
VFPCLQGEGGAPAFWCRARENAEYISVVGRGGMPYQCMREGRRLLPTCQGETPAGPGEDPTPNADARGKKVAQAGQPETRSTLEIYCYRSPGLPSQAAEL